MPVQSMSRMALVLVGIVKTGCVDSSLEIGRENSANCLDESMCRTEWIIPEVFDLEAQDALIFESVRDLGSIRRNALGQDGSRVDVRRF